MKPLQPMFLGLLAGLLVAGCGSTLFPSQKPEPKLQVGESAPNPDAPPPFPDIVMKAQEGRVAVIMFHDVIKERTKDSVWFDCTIDEFQKDIDSIVQNGFTVLSLDQLYKHLTDGTLVPPKSIVLTFDDNYQGIYDNALPILRQHKFPAAVFVHTYYVGSTQGHPKMTWEELGELQKEGLVTIGAHTVTHPGDLKALPEEDQKRELVDSKTALDQHLGVPMVYMAYPDGSNDATTQRLAKDAGYKMSFTMEPTPAEGSPNILCVGRYEAKKFDQAMQDEMQELDIAPVAMADVQLKKIPVSCEAGVFDGVKMVLVRGGAPVSVQSPGREGVGQFVTENHAIAGINGTFFSMAAIASNDNQLIGPARPQNVGAFLPDNMTARLPKLKDRPMIFWGPTRLAIVPFLPGAMNQESIYKNYMPDYTDAFLAGAWIVHDGKPRSKDEMTVYASKDIMDFRKRAFFGVTKDGEIVCGASQGSITTEDLGRAAAAAGASEAVLLDSGFSTSVVYDGLILATGHSDADHASRPVPHAIVLVGDKGTSNLGDLKTVPATQATALSAEDAPKPARRRHRRRRR